MFNPLNSVKMKENKTQSQAIQQIFVSLPVWNIESITGYKPQTTFWQDFSIADRFGATAVQDTFNRAFAEWKSNYIYLTEMVMVLNHKIWQWYQKNDELSKLYDKLWKQADEYACDNLKDNELSYFYQTTD